MIHSKPPCRASLIVCPSYILHPHLGLKLAETQPSEAEVSKPRVWTPMVLGCVSFLRNFVKLLHGTVSYMGNMDNKELGAKIVLTLSFTAAFIASYLGNQSDQVRDRAGEGHLEYPSRALTPFGLLPTTLFTSLVSL